MRPRNQTARDQLSVTIARRAAVSAPELAMQLNVSIPTLHRALSEVGDRLLVTGKARRTRYALRRSLRGEAAALPLYEVDRLGRPRLLGPLSLVYPEGSHLQLGPAGWPVPDESKDGWWSGLPYPLYDMRPQGYMGRQLARAEHRNLGVSANPEDWSDDDVAFVLSRLGSDVSGSLILGDGALQRWQADKLAALDPLPGRALAKAYAALAERAVAAGIAGSSAAGEFPKFAASRELNGMLTPHVLVKFSGADGSPAVQRWSDLLVCEHLALEAASNLPGLAAARSRILQHGGRCFLEVERFDRHGAFGRSRLASLATVDAALIGDGASDWTRVSARMAAAGRLSTDDVLRIQHLWWFGRLIANSDMHAGNLSFEPHQGVLHLAPAYDMLPMRYAPLAGGEVAPGSYEPPVPLPTQRAVWDMSCKAALGFWRAAARDRRISEAFRQICVQNQERLQRVADRL